MFNLILIAVLAIPVLMLELLYVRHWFRDDYMKNKKMKPEKFRSLLQYFREYEKGLKTGEIQESEDIRHFRINEGSCMMFWKVTLFLDILILYVYGVVLMAIYVCVTQAIWSKCPFAVVFVVWFVIAIFGIAAFPEIWRFFKGNLTDHLDATYYFLTNFERMRQIKKKNKNTAKEIKSDFSKEKKEHEIPWAAVLIAALFGAAACIIVLYDAISNIDDWQALFGREYLTRPAMLAGLICLIVALLVIFTGKIIAGWKPVNEAKKKVKNNYKSMQDVDILDILTGFLKLDPELNPEVISEIESKIRAMCQTMGIKGVKIDMVSDPTKNAMAEAHILKGHNIYMGSAYCSCLRNTFPSDEQFVDVILLILGHELAHLQTMDSFRLRSRKLLLLLLIVFILIPGMAIGLLNMAGISGRVFFLLLFFYYIFMAVCFFSVVEAWTDIRWQGQVDELRADRTGFQVSGVKETAFKDLANFHQKECGLENAGNVASTFERKVGWIKKLERKLNGEPVPDLHPSWQVRVQEIEKYGDRKWSVMDDIRYGLRFTKNMKLHKDWKL